MTARLLRQIAAAVGVVVMTLLASAQPAQKRRGRLAATPIQARLSGFAASTSAAKEASDGWPSARRDTKQRQSR